MGASEPCICVTITDVVGSAPRNTGTSIYVGANSVSGTLGGGAAEWQAIGIARTIAPLDRLPFRKTIVLNHEIGQCCGGHITVEFSRAVFPPKCDTPSRMAIFGAGHVGVAIHKVAAAMDFDVRIFDTRATIEAVPTVVYERIAIPEAVVDTLPTATAIVIATHDHQIDFLIAERALARGGFPYVGMIGSKTKRGVFKNRNRHLGARLEHLTMPIGQTGLGDKTPDIIALHTVAEIIQAQRRGNR